MTKYSAKNALRANCQTVNPRFVNKNVTPLHIFISKQKTEVSIVIEFILMMLGSVLFLMMAEVVEVSLPIVVLLSMMSGLVMGVRLEQGR